MTEAEWLTSSDPRAMLLDAALAGASPRKLRLFTTACCRRLGDAVLGEVCCRTLEVDEHYADSKATEQELAEARCAAEAVSQGVSAWAARAVVYAAAPDADLLTAPPATLDRLLSYFRQKPTRDREREAQARLLRDVFGTPFRLARLEPAWLQWRHGRLREMAHTIYARRAFADLPILADAFEEAGCQRPDVLRHCRGGGEHVPGCWVVDLLRGVG